MTKRFWLMKSEPETFSIEDLRRLKISGWDGVRNYQARNFIKEMQPGDEILFYHSNAAPPGVAGLAEVVRAAYPDPTQFDPENGHYDPKALPEKPIWFQVDVRHVRTFDRLLALDELRGMPSLSDMLLFKRSRLSVQPVSASQRAAIVKRAQAEG